MNPEQVQFDRRKWIASVTGAGLFPPVFGQSEKSGKPAIRTGMVVGQPEGALAGMKILSEGGNAMDAAIAAAFVACVVAPASCGVGGYGGHMVVFQTGRGVNALDFNSKASTELKSDQFEKKPELMKVGWLSAGVPGTLAGLQKGLDLWGTRKLSQVLKPAIRLAREGFPLSAGLASAIKASLGDFRKDSATARLFLKKDQPVPEGTVFQQHDLASLLEGFAKDNRVDRFYRGDVAKSVAMAFANGGGQVTEKDLADYEAVLVEPLKLEWNGSSIYTAPLTAGGMTVIQVAGALKSLGWEKLDPQDPRTTLLRLEIVRQAWADRLNLLGDPQKVKIPVDQLLSDRHKGLLAEKAVAATRSGHCLPGTTDGRSTGGTIHISSIDETGMMVSLTLTHGEAFGARVTVPGLGVVLGHGISRFDTRPGHPNGPGPGKKPLHNMCPTLLFRGEQPWVTLGATGGRKIVNTVQDLIVRLVGEKQDLAQAGKSPRIHNEGDNQLHLSRDWPGSLQKAMTDFGYRVRSGASAQASAVERKPTTGELVGLSG